MKKSEIIHLLKELKKEHRELWKDMNDDVSPKVIDDTIKFLKEEKK